MTSGPLGRVKPEDISAPQRCFEIEKKTERKRDILRSSHDDWYGTAIIIIQVLPRT